MSQNPFAPDVRLNNNSICSVIFGSLLKALFYINKVRLASIVVTLEKKLDLCPKISASFRFYEDLFNGLTCTKRVFYFVYILFQNVSLPFITLVFCHRNQNKP